MRSTFLIIGVLLFASRCDATLMVLARTPTGFILGTNVLDSSGTAVCKADFGDHLAVIHQSNMARIVDPQTPGKVLLDIAGQVRQTVKSSSSTSPFEQRYQSIVDQTNTSTAEAMKTMEVEPESASEDELNEFVNRLLFVGMDNGSPIAYLTLILPPSRFGPSQIKRTAIELTAGQGGDYTSDAVKPLTFAATREAAIAALKAQLEQDSKEIGETRPGPSFQGPYILAEVLVDKVTVIYDPAGACGPKIP